ncbi:hypothetical protein PIB30_039404 [Stylosanthes scabra]|uniref:DUF223 domain-containing protein n=1 Tax=Stylosanthes scabra TaxID=79078 RepID=A0ABU6QE01_9FABA|nr:hypothetical protein [Stylosanthes scabra]
MEDRPLGFNMHSPIGEHTDRAAVYPPDIAQMILARQVSIVKFEIAGDRILCSVPKASFGIYKTLIKEFGIYNMRDFIVQAPGKGVRSTLDKFRLTFHWRTSVNRLSNDAFPFSPFRITPYVGVIDMRAAGQSHLIDCMGHVVGKEEVVDMVTRNGDLSKRMAVYLEDLEGRKMKCTLFRAEMVMQFNNFILRNNGQPVIMVAQLFKPNFYLDETSIQSTFHSSRIMFNPDFPEVVLFRERLLALGDIATQGIAQVPTQTQNSVSGELASGTGYMLSLQTALVVSMFFSGIVRQQQSWGNARDMKDANPEVDGASYPKVFDDILEKKYLLKISVKRKNISNVDQVYSVLKVSDDSSQRSQRSAASVGEDSVSNGVVTLGSQDADAELVGSGVVSLSKVMFSD